jgi:voltage-gated sodium channel
MAFSERGPAWVSGGSDYHRGDHGPGILDPFNTMIERCRRIVATTAFQNGVLAVIVLNAVLIGLATDPGILSAHRSAFHFLNTLIQAVFVVEITVRIVAHAPRVHRFFADGWNLFDFTVVALSLLPAVGPFATVARLARLLRALRLVSVVPELRLIVSTMVRSIPSMGHVLLLLGLIVYVYAVVGVHLFRGVDPDHWGSLPRAGLTLFEILTLEGWIDIQQASFAATRWAWVFYTSYVVVAVFVVVNLFIAIIINNLETVKGEERASRPGDGTSVTSRLQAIRTQLEEIEKTLRGANDR